MNSIGREQATKSRQRFRDRKPQLTLTFKRSTPAEAKGMLLQRADVCDPKVLQLRDYVEY